MLKTSEHRQTYDKFVAIYSFCQNKFCCCFFFIAMHMQLRINLIIKLLKIDVFALFIVIFMYRDTENICSKPAKTICR